MDYFADLSVVESNDGTVSVASAFAAHQQGKNEIILIACI